jgi:hypothetical protein
MITIPRNPTTLGLSTIEFLRRFLQHILPKGIVNLLCFGFSPRVDFLVVWVMLSILLVACGTAAPAEDGISAEEIAPIVEVESVESVQDAATAVSTRTPLPSPLKMKSPCSIK